MTKKNNKNTASGRQMKALASSGQIVSLQDLLVGSVYELRSRNLLCGVWTGETFIGVRDNFGTWRLDSEGDFEQGGSAIPLRMVGKITSDIFLREFLAPVCRFCGINTTDDGTEHLQVSPECPRPKPVLQANLALLDALQEFSGEIEFID